MQGLLDENGKFLSIVQVKHNVHLNFLSIIIAAIPIGLKKKAHEKLP